MSITLEELASRLGATVDGDASRPISGCAPIESAGPEDITFLANSKYARYLDSTNAAAVLIDAEMPCPAHVTRVICADPYFAFRNTLVELYGYRQHPDPIGTPRPADDAPWIAASATVHDDAVIGAGTRVLSGAVIDAGATIGARCVLYPGSYVGRDAAIGDETVLYPNVTVYERCRIGARCQIHSSTVVGQDGFGYATHAGAHHKIPQTGIVVIEDDVELGAGCAIERAAMGETRIGAGTKFADLISIGHGTTIGRHCLLVSLVGISGSVELGNYVVLGGQSAVVGHLKVGDFVQAAGRTAIASDIEAGRRVGGVPAVDHERAKRNVLAGRNLHEMSRRLRTLERRLAALESPPE